MELDKDIRGDSEKDFAQIKALKERSFIVILGGEIDLYNSQPGFEEHSYVITDPKGIKEFGEGACFVDRKWAEDSSLFGE